MTKQEISLAYGTDIGLVRKHNEDAFGYISPEELGYGLIGYPMQVMVVVADGMGGQPAGEVASAMTIECVIRHMRAWTDTELELMHISRAGERSYHDAPGFEKSPEAQLLEAIAEANREVFNRGQMDPLKRGMGTTCTAAAISDDRLHVAHIGDSRAYIFRNGEFDQLTCDHSWVQEQVDSGNLTVEAARSHPRRNVVTRAIGLDRNAKVDTYTANVLAGDIVLLCTDGLNGMLTDEEISTIINSSQVPQVTCDALIQAAKEAGGYDNITAIIIKVE